MFWLNRNKQKTHPNSLKESIFRYFSKKLGMFRFVTKQICLFWYRFETPKQTKFFSFWFHEKNWNKRETDLVSVRTEIYFCLFRGHPSPASNCFMEHSASSAVLSTSPCFLSLSYLQTQLLYGSHSPFPPHFLSLLMETLILDNSFAGPFVLQAFRPSPVASLLLTLPPLFPKTRMKRFFFINSPSIHVLQSPC